MKTIIELITDEIKNVFTECGYDEAYAKVTVSNRPDLCEFQCNGAMAAAKVYKKAPFMIADEVVAKLADNKMFSKIESVKPGFININLCEDYLAGYLNEMSETEKFGYVNADKENDQTGAARRPVFAYAKGCQWIFYCGQDSCTGGTGTMPWEIICRCKCLPPSNGTGRDRFPVRTLPYAGTSAAYIRTE